MSTLSDFEIIINPGVDYVDKIIKDVVRDEGWTICRTDYETWSLTHAKFWFFIAKEKGTNVVSASVMLALDEFSSTGEPLFVVGCYYCHPKYRGFGLGTKLFDIAMSIVPKDANVTLSGVMKMSAKYKKKYVFSHIGLTLADTFFRCKDIQKLPLVSGIATKYAILYLNNDYTEVNWAEVEAYDNTINPRPHPKFLKKWIINEGTHTRVAYSDGKVVGLCCIREDMCGDLACAPLYAENKDICLVLLSDILASIDLTKFRNVLFLHSKANKEAVKLSGAYLLRFLGACMQPTRHQSLGNVTTPPSKRYFLIGIRNVCREAINH